MKQTNPERQKKVKAAYRKKLAAYRKSGTHAVVKARAGGRCENTRSAAFIPFFGDVALDVVARCDETDGLQHHHLTYARFGGDEIPSDILVVCTSCHRALEAVKPAGNRFTRR